MPGAIKKSFDVPDETRKPDHAEIHILDLGGVKVAQATFQPGWRWSESIKPIAQTDSCQAHHEGTIVQGRLHVRHDDGTELEVGVGDAYVIQPGHDAWVVGDEAVIAFEFDSRTVETFAAKD